MYQPEKGAQSKDLPGRLFCHDENTTRYSNTFYINLTLKPIDVFTILENVYVQSTVFIIFVTLTKLVSTSFWLEYMYLYIKIYSYT